jgi:hypothetical protein
MDPIWEKLPSELSDYICNKLSQVRSVPVDLKEDLISYTRYDETLEGFCEIYGDDARITFDYECYLFIKRIVTLVWSINARTKDIWRVMTPNDRNFMYNRSLIMKQ